VLRSDIISGLVCKDEINFELMNSAKSIAFPNVDASSNLLRAKIELKSE
jgi:hypothetical protein